MTNLVYISGVIITAITAIVTVGYFSRDDHFDVADYAITAIVIIAASFIWPILVPIIFVVGGVAFLIALARGKIKFKIPTIKID